MSKVTPTAKITPVYGMYREHFTSANIIYNPADISEKRSCNKIKRFKRCIYNFSILANYAYIAELVISSRFSLRDNLCSFIRIL